MRAFLSDFLTALAAARATRKRTNHLARRHQQRLVNQAARLASMNNSERSSSAVASCLDPSWMG